MCAVSAVNRCASVPSSGSRSTVGGEVDADRAGVFGEGAADLAAEHAGHDADAVAGEQGRGRGRRRCGHHARGDALEVGFEPALHLGLGRFGIGDVERTAADEEPAVPLEDVGRAAARARGRAATSWVWSRRVGRAEGLVLGGCRPLLRPHADVQQRRRRHGASSRRRPACGSRWRNSCRRGCIRQALSLSSRCGHNGHYDAWGRRDIGRLCRADALGARRRALRAVARRRRRAMDELVRLMTPPLWHVVRAYGLDRALAQDVVQTTWLTLVRRHESITDPQAVSGWLTMCRPPRGVARRQAAAPRRPDRGRKRSNLIFLSTNPPSRPPPPTTSPVACGSRSRTLNERCQRLLRIVAFEERPDYARIAEDLAMPIGSIGPTRQRCLGKLRAVLEGDGWGGDDPMDTEDFAADAALFARMRAMWEDVDPVPADLVDRMVAAVAVEDLSREYALLTLVEGSSSPPCAARPTPRPCSSATARPACSARDRDRGRLAARRRMGGCRGPRDPARPGRARVVGRCRRARPVRVRRASRQGSRGCASSCAAPTATCTTSRPRSSKCDQRRADTDVWRAVRDEERS